MVFSTSVEVFPINRLDWRAFERLLHVRGGVSAYVSDGCKNGKVFSTSVEVFPIFAGCDDLCGCLLHVRGGVSGRLFAYDKVPTSSPRPWRCFHSDVCALALVGVFSTSVEVFPELGWSQCADPSLLHVRGGVSIARAVTVTCTPSSPRPWRCFQSGIDRL